jgi:DNA-directed RNA polymerase I and III subunit RPAC2
MIEPNAVSSGYPETCLLQDEKVVALSTTNNMDAITFSIKDEDHTIGNALRWIIMKNPNVTFCGYSIPHPSEFKIHFRIQTDGTNKF